jgi:hypothetical protein
MPQVTIRRPLCKLDLRNQLRSEPHTVFLSSLVNAHCVRFFSGRLANGQVSVSNPLNLLATSRRTSGTKSFLTLGGIEKPVALVVADYQSIKRISWRVPADHELLSRVDPVFNPSAGSLPGLRSGLPLFSSHCQVSDRQSRAKVIRMK